jgi:hypothetical protein
MQQRFVFCHELALLEQHQRARAKQIKMVSREKMMSGHGNASDATRAAASALAQVLNGIITGEGPTTRGRVHFSRTLDCEDAALCEQILLEGGSGGVPVSRAEAEVLFSIDAAATERSDQGRFDSLFAKAVAHYVLAAAGCAVPPRDIALARETPLATWAVQQSRPKMNGEVLAWIKSQVNGRRRLNGALAAIITLVSGAAASSAGQSIASLLDLSA